MQTERFRRDLPVLIDLAEKNLDFLATINLLAAFCKEVESGRVPDKSLAHFIADLLIKAAPQERLRKAQRNIRLIRTIASESRSGGREEAFRMTANRGADSVGRDRLLQIVNGRTASVVLAEFIDVAQRSLPPTKEQLMAAKDTAAQIRHRLLADSSKGRETRAALFLINHRAMTTTELDEEIYSVVEQERKAGIRPSESYRRLADLTGMKVGAIKKTHQRVRANRRNDLETAAKAAGVAPLDIQQALETQNEKGDKSVP